MSVGGGDTEKLSAVLKKLLKEQRPAVAVPDPVPEGLEPACAMLLYSFLLWESTPKQASACFTRLLESIIDLNDLRVAMPGEIVEISGMRDGLAVERAERLRASLNDVFRREHLVTLERLGSASKREVRDYLDGLEGMPPFVAARLTLLGFGGHAIPMDGRLLKLLTSAGVFESGENTTDAERWIERQIRATDAAEIVLLLESWRESDKGGAKKQPRKRAPSSRSTKKGS